jgi:hypothetical protein
MIDATTERLAMAASTELAIETILRSLDGCLVIVPVYTVIG